MKISVVSPSNRSDGLEIVSKCLMKQTFSNNDFEWLICGPTFTGISYHIPEPKKKKGDFYNLNKAWNACFNRAKGELIVSIVDYTEFEPDTLAKLWEHYVDNPTVCISGLGVQYKDGKISWVDPRIERNSVYLISPVDMELRLASIPRRAIQAVGGMDEEYDKVVAISEKELCLRIGSLGYKFYVDKGIIYKFYAHEDHGSEWDRLYSKSVEMLNKHTFELLGGTRKKLNYVNRE